MKIQEIKKQFDKVYGFDLYRTDRKRYKVYARKVFVYYCRQLDYTFQSIGQVVNVDHSNCIHYINSINTITRVDKINFNKVVDSFEEKIPKFEVQEIEKPKEIKRDKLNGILEDFNVLLELNDIDIQEFKETRLKPFMRMKRSVNNER